jgi:eukaryotic-like serine/threonine-protein kinase
MSESSNREKDLFLRALDLTSAAERAAFLAGACDADEGLRRHVEAMLRAHATPDSFLEKPAAALGITVDASDGIPRAGRNPGQGPGTRVGPYKLLEPIGEGGMGVVFMAEQQEPVRRMVALKIIKPGMDSAQVLARFEAERQALALMDHPNIAKVLDAGATPDGLPYFVMELVKGTPITTFCDANKLSSRQRLELFVLVCQAIQHAHQKGVIHRDIKPSNVLIALYDDKPVPKVIDFGIAKAAGQPLTARTLHTGFGAIVGTPEYMSPEQATFNQLDIDTRSDVYSLGILLYELLTGTTPVDKARLEEAAILEVLRVVREEEPPRPSVKLSTTAARAGIAASRGTEADKLAQLLRGELDWIVMKSLEKDRNRRYETAAGLARDVGRYLADELVEARPPSAGYRMRKFVKRHRGTVLAVSLVMLALLAGMLGTTWGFLAAVGAEGRAVLEYLEANRQKGIAQKNEAKTVAAEGHTAKALAHNVGLRLVLQSEHVRPSNPGLAMLLAIEGAEHAPGLLANNALLASLDQSREERMIPGGGDGVLCFSTDSRRLLIATSANFGLWDMVTGKELVRFEKLDENVGKHLFAAACFGPDGKRVLTTTDYGRVRLWDAASGKALTLLEEGAKPGEKNLQSASPAQFSPDGRFVLTTYAGVRLWDTLAGKEHLLLKGQERPVFWAAFSKDGKKIVTTAAPSLTRAPEVSATRIWDVASGTQLEALEGQSNTRLLACFNPDNLRVLTVAVTDDWSPVRTLCRLCNAQTGKEVVTLDALSGFPQPLLLPWASTTWALDASAGFPSALFSPDGNRILVLIQGNGRTEPRWHFYDARSGKLLGSAKSHFSAAAAFSTDSERVAFFGQGSKTVELWNAKSIERIESMEHSNGVSAAAFSPDGQRLATCDAIGVHIWAVAGQAERRLGRWTQFEFLAVSPDGRSLATRTPDPQEVAVWDLTTGREIVRIKGKAFAEVPFVRFTPDGRKIIFGNQSGSSDSACVGDVRTGRVVAVIGGSYLRDLDISPDGLRAVTNRGDRELGIWDLATGKTTASLDFGRFGSESFISPNRISNAGDMQFSPDGRWLVTGQWSGPRLRDGVTGTEVALLSPVAARVRFSPDGRHLLTWPRGDSGKVARVWDAGTRKEVSLLEVEGADKLCDDPVFSSDGAWVSFICYDGKRLTARVWEVATGKELLALKSPEAGILTASFSPDKTQIVTACTDKTVRLWDARTGELLAVFHGHRDAVTFARFIPEGRVLSVDKNGSARVWPVDPLPAAKVRAPRELTAEERKQYEVPPALRR